MPERKLATCHADSEHSLISAPPVEKSAAAANTFRRAVVGVATRARYSLAGRGRAILAPGRLMALLLLALPSCATAPDQLMGPTPLAASTAPRDALPVEHMAAVGEGVFRSAAPGAEGYGRLSRFGVRTVIDLRLGAEVQPEAIAAGLDTVRIPLKADIESEPPTRAQIGRFFDVVLDPARQPVLFHCRTGKDRTGTMAALYRIEIDGWSNDRAIAEMQAMGYHDYYRDLIAFVRTYQPIGLVKRLVRLSTEEQPR